MAKNKLKNYGYKRSIKTPDNHVLGGLGLLDLKILNPERDWITSLPLGEIQARRFDTNSCPQFGTLNGIETLSNKLKLPSKNYSERALAILSKNSPDGNDPHTVCETVRHSGLLEETDLPFDDSLASWEEYMKPNPLTSDLVKKGEKWLTEYKFGHRWVFTEGTLAEKQSKLLEALQYSPIPISVTAWRKRNGLYYKEKNDRDNHWCLLVAGEKGKPWMIYDSYFDDGAFIKQLEYNYNFEDAKVISIDQILLKKSCFLSKFLLCGK